MRRLHIITGSLVIVIVYFGYSFVFTSSTSLKTKDSSLSSSSSRPEVKNALASTSSVTEDPNMIHVLTSMPLLTVTDINSTSYKHYKPELMERRMEEFVTGVQRTLDHSRVIKVHFMCDKTDIIPYLKSKINSNLNKLVFHPVKDARRLNTPFLFAYKNLQNKIIMVNPADVYPEKGFEKLNRDTMVKKKIFYSLTRYGRKEKYCDMSKQASSNSCHDKRYMGSHDAYMFVPTGEAPPKAMKMLDVFYQDYGTENMIIWAYQHLLKYTVLNPCKVLHIYHIHCSNVRDANRKRINKPGNTGHARPTDRLE